MMRWMRPLVGATACALLGALAWLVFGGGPGTVEEPVRDDGAWELPAIAARDLAPSDDVWAGRRPWGAVAGGAEGPAEAEPPPAIPVGTARERDGLHAVFLAPDGTTARLRVGDEIPGGGRVDAVTESNVSWTDPRGDRHEQRLLVDPLPFQANSR